MRSQSVGAGGGESSQAGMSSGQGQQQQQEVMTLAELQKMSAQLSGYYTGLTQGLSRDEHHAVMRFFLDGIREVVFRILLICLNHCGALCSTVTVVHPASHLQATLLTY